MNPAQARIADKLAEQFAQIADDLLKVGMHPGAITYALVTAMAILAKVHGNTDLATFKALVCDTIDETWRADDAALRIKNGNKSNPNGN